MTSRTTAPELVACPSPWCDDPRNAEAVVIRRLGAWSVECQCGMRGPEMPTEAEAIVAWTTRRTPSAEEVREACAKVAEDAPILSDSRRPGSFGHVRADHAAMIAAAIRALPLTTQPAPALASEVERLRVIVQRVADGERSDLGHTALRESARAALRAPADDGGRA